MTAPHPPAALERCLRAVWRRGQRKHFVAGLLAAGGWAGVLFLAAVAVDWVADLPAWARGAAVAALAVFAIDRGRRHGWRLLRRFDAGRIAADVERWHGGLNSLLVTAEQFARRGAAPGTSAAMWAVTQRHADEVAARLRPADLISFRELRRPLLAALAAGAIVAACAVIDGPLLAAGAARLFTPWLAVSYPTKTRIDLADGDLVVQEGARASIAARLSGVVPGRATFLLQTGAGRPREMAVDVAAGRCEYVLESAARDFTYRIKAGDARTPWHTVRVIPAPRIEAVEVRLDYPSYMERPAERVESLTLTVPEHTAVHGELTLDRPVRAAVWHRDGEPPRPLEVRDDGRRIVFDDVATASRGSTFSWVEREHGFTFTSPRSYLQVAADQPPRIELTAPAENLHALLGRPLRFAIRAQDDHGLGPAGITCRVNQRPEKVVVLDTPIRNGEGEQQFDWDYRAALPDLQEGDTVSFVVEVADRYPGAAGPHRARTDARRVMFLSREEYLVEIGKKLDRLLSRVRTIYRQERAAHAFVRDLDPRTASFAPSSQLEAVRQEMIREQLEATAAEVRALLDDLAANGVGDVVESGSLDGLGTELQAIAATEVAPAAARLRDQAGATPAGPADSGRAARQVNAAARRLAAVVLRRGLDAAREVFARESRMLAEEEAHLRVRGVAGGPAERLAADQEEVAAWLRSLLADLAAGMRREQKPLATLALSRRIVDLRDSGAERGMLEAAALTRSGTSAAAVQATAIQPLLKAEFSVRSGAEYAALRDLRDAFDALMADQQRLLGECEAAGGNDAPALAARQERLLERLAAALVPAIPAPRPRLLDEALPDSPPSLALRLDAERALGAAVAALRRGERPAAAGYQREAGNLLAKLREIVAARVLELGTTTQGLSTLVTTAGDRAEKLEEFETRQVGLVEKTEEAALDEKSPEALVEPQRFLAEELTRFRRDVAAAGESGVSRDALPLLGRLDGAAAAMAAAGRLLAGTRAEEAIEPQESAADLLSQARELAVAQRARLALLQELLSFQQAVGFAGDSMGDVIAEQRDLVAAVAQADEAARTRLLPRLRDLRQCLTDVAPALALVAGRLDAGTPLVFAGSDVEDAVDALEDGDPEEAADILDEASESLARVRGLVAEVRTQTGFIAEIVEHLHEAEAEAADLGFRQELIRSRLAAPGGAPGDLVAEQEALRSTAAEFGRRLERVTGMRAFTSAGERMAEAVGLLRSGRAEEASARMQLAKTALEENATNLVVAITMLHGLPSIEVTTASPAELERLLAVLAVAGEHRRLSRTTQRAGAADLRDMATGGQAIAGRAAAIPPGEQPHPLLAEAVRRLAAAAGSLQDAARDEAIGHQRAADDLLRHFVIDQAIALDTAKPPPSVSDEAVLTEAETNDLYQSTSNFVSDFVSGEAPKEKRTEWEVLAARNRAALNQNFARELPLEYRATLKNYYERVAK